MAYINTDVVACLKKELCELECKPDKISGIKARFLRRIISQIEGYKTADVAEVKHGKWHILPDDPYDESGVPTEEGWYRIITADGQEMTDYFFNKPTMCERGITYWKNARFTIRAWAKMDGGKEE